MLKWEVRYAKIGMPVSFQKFEDEKRARQKFEEMKSSYDCVQLWEWDEGRYNCYILRAFSH